MDDAQRLRKFLQDFVAVEGPKILVHGGGKLATKLGERLGIPSKYSEGRRITDAATLELVTMVYGGLINKQIVAQLQASGCNAIGLTGADGNSMQAVQRPVGEIDFGFVGDVVADGVNTHMIQTLLAAGMTPVLAPLTHDGKGSLLNTNADTIAQEVARALASEQAVRLVFCFDKPGVMDAKLEPELLLSVIDRSTFASLRAQGVITDGMVPKLSNAFVALDAGVQEIIIGQAEVLPSLILGKAGTRIQ